MRLTIRRVGNSLGVIIPRATLERWGLSEGDELVLKDDGIVPAGAGFTKDDLNDLRLERAFEIIRRFSPREIRAKGLANLHRWKKSGTRCTAYGEWERILRDPDDGRLFAAMLGRDEDGVRLRRSAPYVGLLSPEVVREMNEKIVQERKTELLNAIGEGSRFHETYGYYADPVDERTAILPKKWKQRLVNLPPGDTNGAKGLCLDPHDMAVSKYIAARDKDLRLLEALVDAGHIDKDTLLERLDDTPTEPARKSAARARIERHFAGRRTARPKAKKP